MARWLEHRAPCVGPTRWGELYRRGVDLLVLPEDLGAKIADFEGDKVIFAMGLYNAFSTLGTTSLDAYPAQSEDVLAMVCVSDHNVAVMRHAFPSL